MTDQFEAHTPEHREGKFSVYILEEMCGQDLYGVFDTVEKVNAAVHAIVDKFLFENYEVGMTADELFEDYNWLGDHPVIHEHGDSSASAARAYAASRCIELCGSHGSKGPSTNASQHPSASVAVLPNRGTEEPHSKSSGLNPCRFESEPPVPTFIG
jgi:hypothetical protein